MEKSFNCNSCFLERAKYLHFLNLQSYYVTLLSTAVPQAIVSENSGFGKTITLGSSRVQDSLVLFSPLCYCSCVRDTLCGACEPGSWLINVIFDYFWEGQRDGGGRLTAQPKSAAWQSQGEIPKCRLLAKSPDHKIMPLITHPPSFSSSSWVKVFFLLKEDFR